MNYIRRELNVGRIYSKMTIYKPINKLFSNKIDKIPFTNKPRSFKFSLYWLNLFWCFPIAFSMKKYNDYLSEHYPKILSEDKIIDKLAELQYDPNPKTCRNLNYREKYKEIMHNIYILINQRKKVNNRPYNKNLDNEYNEQKNKLFYNIFQQLRKNVGIDKQIEEQILLLTYLNKGLASYNEELEKTLDHQFFTQIVDFLNLGDELTPINKQISFKFHVFEEGIARLLGILIETNNLSKIPEEYFSFLESKLRVWEEEPMSLKKANAMKYFYSKLRKERGEAESEQPIYSDLILPLDAETMKLSADNSYKHDIIFIPGQQSHPLLVWRILYDNDKIERYNRIDEIQELWPDKYLREDIKHLNPRLLSYNYECFNIAPLHEENNVPHYTFNQLSDRLRTGLIEAKVGYKPVIFVAFSMGGIMLKRLFTQALKSGDEDIKGIIFISSPHMGSNVLDDMAQYLKLQLPLMLPFECIGEYAITPQEFIDHMRVHSCISKTTCLMTRKCKDFYIRLQKDFDKLELNCICMTEGQKMPLMYVGVDHTVVKPELARMQGYKSYHIPSKPHNEMQRVKDTLDPSYNIILNFIKDTFN